MSEMPVICGCIQTSVLHELIIKNDGGKLELLCPASLADNLKNSQLENDPIYQGTTINTNIEIWYSSVA